RFQETLTVTTGSRPPLTDVSVALSVVGPPGASPLPDQEDRYGPESRPRQRAPPHPPAPGRAETLPAPGPSPHPADRGPRPLLGLHPGHQRRPAPGHPDPAGGRPLGRSARRLVHPGPRGPAPGVGGPQAGTGPGGGVLVEDLYRRRPG